jgi:hypothetical protein
MYFTGLPLKLNPAIHIEREIPVLSIFQAVPFVHLTRALTFRLKVFLTQRLELERLRAYGGFLPGKLKILHW